MTENTAQSSTKKQPVTKKHAPSFTLFLILITWIFLGAVIGYSFHLSNGKPLELLTHVAESGDVSIDIAAMNERIYTLEQQVEVLESTFADAFHRQKAQSDDRAMESEAENLDDKLSELLSNEERVENPASNNHEISSINKQQHEEALALTSKVAQLEAALAESHRNASSNQHQQQSNQLLIAAYQLEEAVTHYKPYGKELARLEQASAGNPSLSPSVEALRISANQGITPPHILHESFFAQLDPAIQAIRSQKENPSLLDSIAAKFPSIISVRKTVNHPETVGDKATDAEALLAKAEHQVQEKHFGQAADMLQHSQNDVIYQYFSNWAEQASQHEEALHQVRQIVNNAQAISHANNPPSAGEVE